MTAEKFAEAVEILKRAGVIPTGHGWRMSLSKKLGCTRQTINNFEKHGTKQMQTDYAFSAIMAGLEPHGR